MSYASETSVSVAKSRGEIEDLVTRAEALLEKLKGDGRAQVCTLEPSDCREAAAVLTELLAAMDGARRPIAALRRWALERKPALSWLAGWETGR